MSFTQHDADAIADKLDAHLEPGRRHDLAQFYYEGKLIFQFGIRRASKDVGHGYIPRQMHISQGECRKFRACNLSKEWFIAALREKGLI